MNYWTKIKSQETIHKISRYPFCPVPERRPAAFVEKLVYPTIIVCNFSRQNWVNNDNPVHKRIKTDKH